MLCGIVTLLKHLIEHYKYEVFESKVYEDLADRIRDDLLEKGIILDDSREGTTWRRSQD